jgi:hypothetical protein
VQVGSNAYTLNIAKGRGETTGLGGSTTRLLADTDSQPGSLLQKLMAQKAPGAAQQEQAARGMEPAAAAAAAVDSTTRLLADFTSASSSMGALAGGAGSGRAPLPRFPPLLPRPASRAAPHRAAAANRRLPCVPVAQACPASPSAWPPPPPLCPRPPLHLPPPPSCRWSCTWAPRARSCWLTRLWTTLCVRRSWRTARQPYPSQVGARAPRRRPAAPCPLQPPPSAPGLALRRQAAARHSCSPAAAAARITLAAAAAAGVMSHLGHGDLTGGTTSGLSAHAAAAAAAPAPAGPLPAISFPDFLQLIDMQFLDHIRRGTSINMVDLAQPPPPSTLEECLVQVGRGLGLCCQGLGGAGWEQAVRCSQRPSVDCASCSAS